MFDIIRIFAKLAVSVILMFYNSITKVVRIPSHTYISNKIYLSLYADKSVLYFYIVTLYFYNSPSEI